MLPPVAAGGGGEHLSVSCKEEVGSVWAGPKVRVERVLVEERLTEQEQEQEPSRSSTAASLWTLLAAAGQCSLVQSNSVD